MRRRFRESRRQSAVVLGAGLLLGLLIACTPARAMPVLFAAPDFHLTDQDGRPFSASDLAGRVVLADFIYTTFPDVCPLISGSLAQVRDGLRQARLLGDGAALVSFSVDPERDTPEVLRVYGGRFEAVPAEWRFLTGDRADEEELLVTGFKLDRPFRGTRPDGGTELSHTSRVVLIDQRGQVRALYDGEALDVRAVIADIRRLAA